MPVVGLADDPPTLLIRGTADRTVPVSHSERVHAAFEEAQVETELIIMEGASHGFRGEQAEQGHRCPREVVRGPSRCQLTLLSTGVAVSRT